MSREEAEESVSQPSAFSADGGISISAPVEVEIVVLRVGGGRGGDGNTA